MAAEPWPVGIRSEGSPSAATLEPASAGADATGRSATVFEAAA
jgi:hypothetical protein